MKIVAFPADNYGCGHHRVIYPCKILQQQGIDVTIVPAANRNVKISYNGDHSVADVALPDCDVVLFQRLTDKRMIDVITFLREKKNIAVVIDVDDDLSAIHPANPAWTMLDPNRAKREVIEALRLKKIKPEQADKMYGFLMNQYTSSWLNLIESCKRATMVTVSTPGLIKRYAAHGRGRVVNNYAPDHFFSIKHEDNDVVGWPAAIHSHPNDPQAVGNAISRLVSEGIKFVTIGSSLGSGRAFGMNSDPESYGEHSIEDWPKVLTRLGVGIAPLADTRFNASKSWLKPLEMSAVGVPWIASPRAEYTKINKMGAGLLAEKPRDWYRTIKKLVDDPNLRADLSAAGRAVAYDLRLSANAYRWYEAFEESVRLQREAERPADMIL